MTTARRRIVAIKPSRRGCRTCRIRKIRCDETKPNCTKCTSTGRKCDGYEASPERSSGASSNRCLLPFDALKDRTLRPANRIRISPSICMTTYEQQSFDYFRIECAEALHRSSPGREWVRYAMHFALQEPAVFYAVTAFAEAQRGVTLTMHHVLAQPSPVNVVAQRYAERQYQKATSSLRRYIDEVTSQNLSIEPVVMCCILFVGFEMLRGKQANAVSHLRLGRRVVEGHWSSSDDSRDHQQSVLDPGLQKAVMELITAWCQCEPEMLDLDTHRSLLDQDSQNIALAPQASLPNSFTSVEQARECLDSLLTAGQQVQIELIRLAETYLETSGSTRFSPAVKFCMTRCLSRTVPVPAHSHLSTLLQDIVRGHDAWLEAVAEMEHLQALRPSKSLTFLKLRHFYSSLSLRTYRQTREMRWDHFTSQWIRALELIESFLYQLKTAPWCPRERLTQYHQSYSLQPGLLSALAIISFKCRDTSIRRRALRLLYDANAQEGAVSGEGIACFAESIMDIEEERARSQLQMMQIPSTSACADRLNQPLAALPEEARFLDVIVSGETRESTRIVCGRFAHERDGELKLLEYIGTGYPMTFQPVNRVVTEFRAPS